MHELSLAQGLVEQLEKAAVAENALRVERIIVVIGKYSGVERDAFEFAFPFAAEGTLSERAKLEIEELPVQVECRQCAALSNPEPTLLLCGQCGSNDVELKGGREFLIRSVELEVP
ncbi:hydrogenase maturation nickel metallochaperone HypA [Pontiella sulfatireligans]|uniref:Hydrogenase maturation factor HypA n=1 Tax=Pontiella sulfatireligans TaxID=2750658 RepID=A0A6C2UGZ0_9BACT|nr:hydrogenase maturation nickel metallochaperone HypA [Pontiella sulfatireligans]VGO19455.1 Hydrogenase/urease nickel incorporation protein HypA [Pontiella sulfatireligans]